MKPNSSSTNAWRLFGTPEVAPRTTHQMKPMPTRPSRIETDERIEVDRPEAAVAELLRAVRQVVTDVLGGVQFFAGCHLIQSYSRTKKAMVKIRTVTTNDPIRRRRDDVLVHRQYQPQQEHDQTDLDCLGPQRADQDAPLQTAPCPSMPRPRMPSRRTMLTAPPKAADSAPSTPARSPPASVRAAVAISLPPQNGADRPAQGAQTSAHRSLLPAKPRDFSVLRQGRSTRCAATSASVRSHRSFFNSWSRWSRLE